VKIKVVVIVKHCDNKCLCMRSVVYNELDAV